MHKHTLARTRAYTCNCLDCSLCCRLHLSHRCRCCRCCRRCCRRRCCRRCHGRHLCHSRQANGSNKTQVEITLTLLPTGGVSVAAHPYNAYHHTLPSLPGLTPSPPLPASQPHLIPLTSPPRLPSMPSPLPSQPSLPLLTLAAFNPFVTFPFLSGHCLPPTKPPPHPPSPAPTPAPCGPPPVRPARSKPQEHSIRSLRAVRKEAIATVEVWRG